MEPNESGSNPTFEIPSDQPIPIYCTRCGSTNLRKAGEQILSLKIEQRYLCKDCGHVFWERTWGSETLDQ